MPRDRTDDWLDPDFDRTRYPEIGDYGLIGDGRICALVSAWGSMDWLCLPSVSSPSVFAALLDRRRGGRFAIRPTAPFRVRRHYDGDTAILCTEFSTEGGRARLVDLVPISGEDGNGTILQPEREVLRFVEGIEGRVEMEVLFDPRPDYGRTAPRIRRRGRLGWCASHHRDFLNLLCDADLEPTEEGLAGRLTVAAGETRCFSLSYANHDVGVIPPLGDDALARRERSAAWWRGWSSRMQYDGPEREEVMRSAITLKLLTYVLSGAVVAAPTAALPEAVGGTRNWDYRFCWLRDATLTLRGFLDLGYREEGAAFLDWLMHSTRLTQPALQVCYDVYGKTNLDEQILDHLEGYKQSAPVRVGNAASGQLQLDVYGEVVMAAYDYVQRGGTLDFGERRLMRGFGKVVMRHWTEPDEGIWEVRSGRQHNTHSKLMCWVALDRLVKLCRQGVLDTPGEDYRRCAETIRDTIEREGWNERLGAYTQTLNGDSADAALLLMAHYGYHPPDHPRMASTYRVIRHHLGRGPYLLRYDGEDGMSGGEGAFGLCSFWEVDYLARAGRVAEAKALFHTLCHQSNDVGLYGEEFDPETGGALGNFPQAFTHVGLIDAALAIEHAERGEEVPT